MVLLIRFISHSVHTEKSNKMQRFIKIYYSIFIWSLTCFGRHTAHHQEPKTALAASGLHTWKVVGRCGCWTLSGVFIWSLTCFGRHTAHHQEPKTALAASGLHTGKVVGRCGCWTLSNVFIWSLTCFGRHTAHHQEPKTALAASGYAYVVGCWTLWLLDAVRRIYMKLNMFRATHRPSSGA
jgi:hypothetical protein